LEQLTLEDIFKEPENRFALKGQDEEREKRYLYWLSGIPSMGAITIGRLWDRHHSFETIYNMEGKQLKSQGLLREKTGKEFDSHKRCFKEAMEEYERMREAGVRFLAFWEEEFPKRLLPIYGRPACVYVRGSLPREDCPSAAIVGARTCSQYGSQMAEYLGRSLSESGVQIVSGMALGIDGAGHKGALLAGGNTYAVLGCGVDICYPKSHYSMYFKIMEKGGVISEYRPGEAPAARNFPMRNRIISGLSDVIIVVEAREKSGSLITVDCGLEQGKEIFAVPGRITDSLSQGCNELIRQGAGMVTSPEDILEFFQIHMGKRLRLHEKNENGLAKKEKMVYSCLDLQPKFIDRIVEESGLSLGECLTLLLELELKGRIIQTASHYYAKKL